MPTLVYILIGKNKKKKLTVTDTSNTLLFKSSHYYLLHIIVRFIIHNVSDSEQEINVLRFKHFL